MSILIKGLNLPKEDRITIQIGHDGDVYLVTDFELKGEIYKYNAVEVKEPHGDIIDRDECESDMGSVYCTPCMKNGEDYNGVMCRSCWVDDAERQMDSAEVIIEAEGKE